MQLSSQASFRLAAIATTAMLIAGCVSNTEFDRDQAYSKCKRYDDPSTKNRCIADAIQDYERERAGDNERAKQSEADAEKRELGRVIAGAE
ncbi:MAG: hypothetical protein ABNH53_03700 [Henriciella sp.]|jgi:outer membrane murein-binding lipoprotein Lpp